MKTFCKLTALLLCAPLSLSANLVTEDFNYPSIATGASLAANAAGGAGWSGGWEGNASVFYHSTTNLSYANYPMVAPAGSGSLYSNTSNYRAVWRSLAEPLGGELWYSYLFRKGGTGQGGLLFNANSVHTTGAPPDWSILVDATSVLNVNVKGGITAVLDIVNAVDYLVVGRIVTGANGVFQIWVNPDLTMVAGFEGFLATLEPDYTYAGTALLEPLQSLGIAAYRGTGTSSVMRIDALRFSDGAGNAKMAFEDVTGVTDRSWETTSLWFNVEPANADGWKLTAFGWLVDEHYPFVWLASQAAWIYVAGGQSDPEDFLGYDYGHDVWFRAGKDWIGYHYDYAVGGGQWIQRGR
jgi:hypothetical protein